MILRIENNIAFCRCNMPDCGNEFQVENIPTGADDFSRTVRGYADSCNCDSCVDKIKAREEEYLRKQRMAELPAVLEAAGVPETFRAIREPFNRPLAEWIWKNRNCNLRIGGDTGRGKTGALCNALAYLAMDCKTVKYRTCRQLFTAYSRSKAGAETDAEKFLNSLYACDVLVIDELVGKAKLTDTGTECLFEIIDRAYSYNRPRIWIAGQFYKGAILKMFGDKDTADAVQRRFDERFLTNLED